MLLPTKRICGRRKSLTEVSQVGEWVSGGVSAGGGAVEKGAESGDGAFFEKGAESGDVSLY